MAIKFEERNETAGKAVKPTGSVKAQIDPRFATPIEATLSPQAAEEAAALPFGKAPKAEKKARSRTR